MKYSSVLGFAAMAAAIPTESLRELPRRADSNTPPVTVKGNAFWAGDKRFYIRGIDYQPGGEGGETDPLSDKDICERDVKEFTRLGINTVRVYMVDNSKDHKYCMDLMAKNGIYLVLDVNTPEYSLNRVDPHTSYNAAYLQNIFATVDLFAEFDNTLAFFSGNEVINDIEETVLAAPYIKAVTRDIRNYIKKRGYRSIPVGYSATDVNTNLMESAQYLNCGTDDVRSDFFAFNDYSWCKSDFKTARWDEKVKNFTDYGIPVFLSEYGCITNGRDFGEVEALMSDKMTSVFSGGLMYEYTLEKNQYGIAKIKGDEIEETKEFALYAKALKENPAPSGSAGASDTGHSVECPAENDSNWPIDPKKLPSMPEAAEKYFDNGAGKGNGFDGKGSQSNAASGLSKTNVTVDGTDSVNQNGEKTSSSGKSADDDNAAIRMSSLNPTVIALMVTFFGAALL